MPIVPSELEYYRSTDDLGGANTGIPVPDGDLNALFDAVDSSGAANGETNYRCIYIANKNQTITLQSAEMYLQSNTPSSSTTMGIGVGTSAAGGVEQTIPNEDTAPIGVFFSDAIDTTQPLGNIPARSWKAIWLRRIVTAGAGATATDGAVLVSQGDTTS